MKIKVNQTVILFIIIKCCLVSIILLGCEATAIYTSQNSKSIPTQRRTEKDKQIQKTGKVEYISASFFANELHGTKTIQNKIINMYGMTALSRSIPAGTRLMLVNEDTQKEAIVTVIDQNSLSLADDLVVSYQVAQSLGFGEFNQQRLKVFYLR